MDIGINCSLKSCNNLDFLPFVCENCGLSYCKEHYVYDKHGCNSKVVTPVNPLVVCTKCKQLVRIQESLDAHLNSGCRDNVEQSFKIPCKFCTEHAPKNLTYQCPQCSARFCLKHRHPDKHECAPPSTDDKKKALVDFKALLQNKIPQTTSSSTKRSAKSSPQIELMKLKQKATGDSSVPLKDRVYANFLLPADARLKELPMFFGKDTIIGVVVDRVAQKASLTNTNNLPGDKDRLFLVGSEGVPADFASKIISLVADAEKDGPFVVTSGMATVIRGAINVPDIT